MNANSKSDNLKATTQPPAKLHNDELTLAETLLISAAFSALSIAIVLLVTQLKG